MAEPYSLLEFVHQLTNDDDLRADFATDPHGTLADHGLAELGPEDVRDALVLVEDTRTAEFSLDHTSDGPSFRAASDDPDAAIRYLTDYVGLPSGPAVVELDRHLDPDDVRDGDPHDDLGEHAPGPHVDTAYDDVDGFGHGSGDPTATPEHDHDGGFGDAGHEQAVFDEPGSYDEFGDADDRGDADGLDDSLPHHDPFDHHPTTDHG